uniref:CCHC-type domain-containing protein n=1 Tax=Lygus hesperus TaxID=30085 RepID=A0A0K8SSG3_LYGHE
MGGTKAAALGAALCGPALTLLSELQHPILYEQLVAALDARYGIKNQMQLHLVLLQSRVQKSNEDIQTYHREMQELGRKAWPQARGGMDCIIVTHFMNGLRDPRIRERVLTSWPETMSDALTVALRMEAVSRLTPPKTVSQCSQVSVEEPPCLAVQATLQHHQGGADRRKLVCWRCDAIGHTRWNCPTRRQTGGSSKSGNEPRSE